MNFTRFIPVLCILMFTISCLPGKAIAIDPRFELDVNKLGIIKTDNKNSVPPRKRPAVKPTVKQTVRQNQKSSRQTMTLHKPTQSSEYPAAPSLAQTDLEAIRRFWATLIPDAAVTTHKQLLLSSDTFELAIDPLRYPIMKTADNQLILLDADGSIPPLIKNLIMEKEPDIRVVSSQQSDGRRFLGDLLAAGGFYSVEENPIMQFGDDPQLRIRSDFKVEPTADSIINNEVILVNSASHGVLPRLGDYMQSQGFKLMEPFAAQSATPLGLRHRIVTADNAEPSGMVDQILKTLAVPVEKKRRLELFRAHESGIGLSVAADHYFVYEGKQYVVANFNGDPVTYTLFRLLETKGYRVVILEPNDSFRSAASKLLARMDLPSSYGLHLLASDPTGRYSLEMSGFMLENAVPGGGSILLTDRTVSKNMRDLLYDHGYQVRGQIND